MNAATNTPAYRFLYMFKNIDCLTICFLAYHMTNGIFKHVYEAISQSVCHSIFYNLVWYLPVSRDLPQCNTWPCLSVLAIGLKLDMVVNHFTISHKSVNYTKVKFKTFIPKHEITAISFSTGACTIKLFTLVIVTVDCKLVQLSMLAFYTLV